MKKYYYNTNRRSEIAQAIYDKRESFDWWPGRTNDQFQVRQFDQSLIEQDSFLKELYKIAPGQLCFFKFPPGVMYNWHKDGSNLFNVNLIFKEQKSFSLFRAEPGDFDQSTVHGALQPVIEVEYQPMCWTMYNAQILHTVANLDTETRYLLTYTIKKDSAITYDEVVAGLS